ncbi:MCE family protein [Nocardia uniformis]|uniref:MCE family protein n=1 Tax=Nocardia uniformis TaxID=53432 RepID=A0A849CA22_9NOCA|nr:MlaD family protein [Nocardia uniformis]NNH72777.1 MCE family protein [Nocardia uniformis]
MQRLRQAIDFVLGTDRHEAAARKRQLWLGIAGMVAAAVLIAASAIIYFLPIGKSTYTAALTEATSAQVGDEIRIAGIAVGTVRSLALHEDSVTMTFTVDRQVFIGAQSTLEIRMLTAVGGHYVSLVPAGDNPLGGTTIPADHVKLPYNLAQAVQDAERPLAAIDGDTLRRNMAALTSALEQNPDSIRDMADAMATFVDLVNRQNNDVSRALDVADEYLTLLGQSRHVIGAMLSKIGLMETVVLNRRAEVLAVLQVVSELLSRIAAIEPAWTIRLQPLAHKLIEAWPQLEQLGNRLGGVADTIGQLNTRLQELATASGGVTIDQSTQLISATAVCVPVPGKGC